MGVKETGLYYLQSRYYNPKTGRFLNADAFVATGQGLLGNNMFTYCNNNPELFTDAAGTRMVPVDVLNASGIYDSSYIESLIYSTEYNSKGALYEYWDDPITGDHVWSRHHTDHGYPKYHKNPHDHQWHKDDNDHNKPGPPLPPNTSFKSPNSKKGNDNSMKTVGSIGCIAIIGYGVYVGVKWAIAIAAAPATAGGSLIVAGVTP